MRWMISGQGWPVGAVLIPAGTVIDGTTTTLPMPPPIDAVSLDDEAAWRCACIMKRRTASAVGIS